MGSAGASEAQAARTERAEQDRKHDPETMESWRKGKWERQIQAAPLQPTPD